jgi:ADP-ribose pyrophosphatase YjhB (NUDIX family)/phosphoglycolate phosphatase-like HAD superfamily hydrolase
MYHLQHFIFDFAGTLFDDADLSFLATQETIFLLSGYTITKEVFEQEFTIPAEKFYYKFIDRKIPFDDINDLYFKVYPKFASQGVLREGVVEAFEELRKQNKTISIFSTLSETILRSLIKSLYLDKYILDIHGGVIDKEKEFKEHLKKITTPAENILYIGDMDTDIIAANKNGIVSAAVLSGYQPLERLARAKPNILWISPKDWLHFFKTLSDKRKSKIPKPYPVVTVGALVFNSRNECLLIFSDKWKYTYAIPGGKIDQGEKSLDALKRELKEETGLDINNIEFFMLQDCIDSEEFYIPQSHFIFLNYVAYTNEERVKLNDEAQSYLWIDPRNALNLKLNYPTHLLIQKYVNERV